LKPFSKGKLSSDFPHFFNKFESSLEISSDTEVYFGAGPGSFTGIKTGASFMASYLYTKGIYKINLISSLDLYSLFIPYYEDSITFVIQPFNVRELFVTIFKWENGKRFYLEKDKFISIQELEILIKRFNYDSIILLSSEEPGTIIKDLFAKHFKQVLYYAACEEFNSRLFQRIPILKTVDIRYEPLIFNYVTAPANIKNDSEFYITMN